MTDNRISLCMIVRDDAPTLGPLLEKLRPHVDEIAICDTGSTDETPSIARRYADRFETFLGCNSADDEKIEDFALARQHVLEMAYGSWHLWLDGDDDFLGAENLRELTNRPESAVQYLVPYEYTHDPAGRVTCLHWRENLVKPRDACKWQIPVHEVLIPSVPMQVIEPTQKLRRIHKKHLSKKAHEPGRNLRILTKYIARVGETDVRSLYYYGVELHHAGAIGESMRVLKRYVQLATWGEEKCLAQLELARIYFYRIGDAHTAIEWATQAMLTKSWPEPYFMLCRAFHHLMQTGVEPEYNAKRAMHWGERGLAEPDTQTVLFVNPMERFEIQHQMSELYFRSNQLERARDAVTAGLQGMPEDPLLQKRAAILEDFFLKNTLVRTAERLRQVTDRLRQTDAFDAGQWAAVGSAVGQFLEISASLPPAPIFREVEPQTPADGCLDLVFYLGEAFERWNPVTLARTGMGGSETMAWELARRLRGFGHRVRVFADCAPEQEGLFDGVEWLHHGKFGATTCDLLISSRRPDACNAAELKAGARVLWIHDVHVGSALTQQCALRIDRILALTQWHKAYLLSLYNAEQAPYPIAHLHESAITVTRNGIDLARFDSASYLPLPAHAGGALPSAPLPVTGEYIPRYEIPDSGIIVGGSIASAEDWAALEAVGVTHCLSVTDPPDVGLPAERLLHLPVPDEGAPFPVANLAKVAEFARSALSGGKLYVHCWVGRSRSPSHAYAILRAVYGLGKRRAIDAIRAHYPWQPPFGEERHHESYMDGIDEWLATHTPAVKRNPKRIVYSSSPDRGLTTLLEMWPAILAEEPEAELHCYYGFDNWEKSVSMGLRTEVPWLSETALRRLKHQLRTLPRVTMHGRVSPEALAREFLTSGVWAYPTWFAETHCITALEAQAAGLYIVTTPVAALNETVADRGVRVPGGWETGEATEAQRAEFVAAVVRAIRGEGQPRTREELRQYARDNFGLDELTKDWDAMLRGVLAEVVERVVPRFQP